METEEGMAPEEQLHDNGRRDVTETFISSIDRSTTKTMRMSLFHVLSLAAIGASLGLWFSGQRKAAIFVGLWPPTFEALKSAAEKKQPPVRAS